MTERSTPPSEGSATVAARGPAPPGLTETGKLRILTAREIEAARSETARTQEALKESEARFRTLFESSPDGIFITDPDTLEILDCNAQACEMNGYSREELVGRSINLLHPEEVRAQTTGGPEGRARFVEQLRQRGVITVESVHVRKDGTTFPMETSMCLLELGGRDVVMGIDRDISERRRAEEELARHREHLEELVASRTAELAVERDRAEAADRLKSAFLATMSHELRTPLNSIIGFTGVLLKGLGGPLTEEQSRQLGMVKSSAQHLLVLINDVLDLSKIEAGQLRVSFTPFALKDAVDDCLRALAPAAERKGLSLVSEVDPAAGTILSDRRRVEQVLLNLVSNAVKFTEAGSVRVSAAREGTWVVIRVRDTGIGIAAEDLPNLFRPFQQLESGLTRRFEGTGLGLSICRRLVEMLRGEISVESVPGRGSTFSFRLPAGGEPGGRDTEGR
ncbi:MAG: PAS domain S-box protein [Thermoanaerobaculia bacterium]|nr:PAS domain S-box protein [Thermoanaerobaculia bacterium]